MRWRLKLVLWLALNLVIFIIIVALPSGKISPTPNKAKKTPTLPKSLKSSTTIKIRSSITTEPIYSEVAAVTFTKIVQIIRCMGNLKFARMGKHNEKKEY